MGYHIRGIFAAVDPDDCRHCDENRASMPVLYAGLYKKPIGQPV